MPLRRTALALAGLLVIPAAPVRAQQLADHPKVRQALALVQTWLEGESAYEQVPGVSAAIVYDQQTLWSGGFGYADPARRTPATAGTVYSICSISKLFTSVALMRLRDEGKLRLDDPVAKHLSWFAIRQTYPDAPDITVEGLLTHASGLPREADYPYWSGPDFRFPTHEQIVAKLKEQATLYPPETYFQYSNLGLTLAGEIVAAEAGQPYADYVRRTVLQPLGLTSTTPEMPAALRGTRLAVGYTALRRDGTRQPVPFFQANGIAPAAGYASTADDLARFAEWQFRLLAKGGEEVLRANTLREMQRVHFVDPDWQTTWGLGFSVWHDGDKTFVGHGGSCPGYRTQLMLHPRSKIAAVFMANASGVNSGRFTQRMYDIVGPAVTAALADSGKATTAPDTALQKYVGSYSDAPWGGGLAALVWDDGLALLGLPTTDPMKALTKFRRVAGEPHTFRRVRDDGTLGETIRFELGPDGRATRYWQFSNPYPRIEVGPGQRAAGS